MSKSKLLSRGWKGGIDALKYGGMQDIGSFNTKLENFCNIVYAVTFSAKLILKPSDAVMKNFGPILPHLASKSERNFYITVALILSVYFTSTLCWWSGMWKKIIEYIIMIQKIGDMEVLHGGLLLDIGNVLIHLTLRFLLKEFVGL